MDIEVELWAQFSIDREIARYLLLEGEAETLDVHATNGGITVIFEERTNEYCAKVHARSLVDGTEITETFCQSADALVEAEPYAPEDPDYDSCAEPPFDPDTGREVDTGGCSTSGGDSGLLFSLLLAGLVGRRRRRQSLTAA